MLKLNDFKEFLEDQGMYYSDELIFNFITSLNTKPFVILSGISGSGKSRIADLLSDFFSSRLEYQDNYELVPVKPNWTDSKSIFGYHNIIDNTYSITPALKIFIRALENPTKPYFLVLDEMNLAKVEHYFSDFLSLLESRKYKKYDVQADMSILDEIFGEDTTLSEAIILSAIDLQSKDFETVETFRNSIFSQYWLKNKSTGASQLAQFRSELNQGRKQQENGIRTDGSRLAGKAFWGKNEGKHYKLKNPKDMDEKTRSKFEKLLENYQKFKAASEIEQNNSVTQEKISLHDSKEPLKTQQNQSDFKSHYHSENGYYVPNKIEIPLNLFVIGTVNIDETTHMFSPKVLDRANVIEFNDIDLFNAYGYNTDQSNVPTGSLNNPCINLSLKLPTSDDTKNFIEQFPEEFKNLVDIFNVLKQKNKHFGYRVFNEISLYVANYTKENPKDIAIALDNQILQKILPKLNGDIDSLDSTLDELKTVIPSDYRNSHEKINKMIETLNTSGYVTFIS